jgi:hypothetical protein
MAEIVMSAETLYLTGLCARERGLVGAIPSEPGPGFDWAGFVEAADRHKVLGLAYSAFSSGRSPSPPTEILARLKREAASKAAAKAMLIAEWRRVDEVLRGASIRVMMIKGPALALQLYGDPGAREFRDIDILVDAGSLKQAGEAFTSIGYEEISLFPEFGRAKQKVLNRASHHTAFKKRGIPAYFEVHGTNDKDIGIAPIGIEEAFERSQGLRFEGIPFPTLERNDHALFVLLHGARHRWCALQWILDAAVMLEGPSLRLDSGPIRSWGGVDPRYALDSFALFAGRLFALPFLDRFQPPPGPRMKRARSIVTSVFEQFAEGATDTKNYKTAINRSIAITRLQRRFIPKLRAWSWIVTPSLNDFRFFRSANLPIFVYYFLRPFFVLVRFARRFAGRIRAMPI